MNRHHAADTASENERTDEPTREHHHEPGFKPSQERGAGSGLMLALIGAAIMLIGMVLAIVTSVSAQSKAATAADLAALAAADAARGLTSGEPCQVAAHLASAHDAELTSCQRDAGGAGTVAVTTRVSTVYWLEWLQDFDLAGVGKARAGPPPIE